MIIEEFKTLYEHTISEFVEKKSKFIANIVPIQTESDAQNYINMMKKKYFNATHNVFAYRLIDRNGIERQSDDGEPSGTAGLPILKLLKKEKIQNTIVIVTRYYGGIPLGIGRLSRAYSTSAKLSIEKSKIVTKYLMENINIISDYNLAGKIKHEIINGNYVLEKVIYTNNVKFITFVKNKDIDNFIKTMINITNNNICIKRYDKVYGFFINNKFYR